MMLIRMEIWDHYQDLACDICEYLKDYDWGRKIFEKAKANGKTIVVNSYETWCGTCTKQAKILNQAEKKFKDIIHYFTFFVKITKNINDI